MLGIEAGVGAPGEEVGVEQARDEQIPVGGEAVDAGAAQGRSELAGRLDARGAPGGGVSEGCATILRPLR